MSFAYEMHLHSSACSACASSTATEMIDAAQKKGYAGVVFTNHFYHGNTRLSRDLPWVEFVEAYRRDYEEAKAYGATKNMDVLFGLEESYRAGKEVLIYGVKPAVIAATPDFRDYSLVQISAFVHKNGGFLACAHPFRQRDYIPDPDARPPLEYVDALEVYNFFNVAEQNERAAALANDSGKQRLCGGDIHNARDFGHEAMVFSHRLPDEAALAAALRANDYELMIEGSIV